MSGFIGDYRDAFNRKRIIGIRRWIYFMLKSVLLFLLLSVVFSLLQYVFIMYTPLFEYVTAPEIKQSNIYGLIFILVVSFCPGVIYLIKGITK